MLVPLLRAIVDGDLPIELSLKGARWGEGIDALGDALSDQLTEAEEKALKEGLRAHREIEELWVILREVGAVPEETPMSRPSAPPGGISQSKLRNRGLRWST